jgi:hypothetical protein
MTNACVLEKEKEVMPLKGRDKRGKLTLLNVYGVSKRSFQHMK